MAQWDYPTMDAANFAAMGIRQSPPNQGMPEGVGGSVSYMFLFWLNNT
jgi:hypothetical protein